MNVKHVIAPEKYFLQLLIYLNQNKVFSNLYK